MSPDWSPYKVSSTFSGSALVMRQNDILFELQQGYANRAEQIENQTSTRFGIASGCKLFTAIAICQLVEQGKLAFTSTLCESLAIDFPRFDPGVTVEQLLTHTSGIPDYFDESVMDDFEELWRQRPMYHIRQLRDFLPMFQHEPMRQAGGAFQYNNAGYIVLGLIVEQASGLTFTDYIERFVFKPADMTDSGYFSLDALPRNTALGYIDSADGSWRTNHYSIPVKGGADGGAFVTTQDMAKLWRNLLGHRLLGEEMTSRLFTPHVPVNETGGHYGYGLWIQLDANRHVFKYHAMGYDPGVSFHSAYYPATDIISVVCSNKSDGAFDLMKSIEMKVGEA
ncbi:serine hydrolase [Exiguobacterium sp. TNDT2]|uniref:serine hydrolase domain-containing protein n=1 Tax=Exiguobacterium sp. TNDT2 TaxID=2233531 RepID=UPI000DEF687A|nr:serine hydrolase [Exiguobacterium sp. TNDT2]